MSQNTVGSPPGKVKPRPKHLDLKVIRQAITAIVSIGHRITGAGLFLFLPLLLCMMERALSPIGIFSKPEPLGGFTKLILLGLLFAYVYHLCAGIRFLLLDFHVGVDRESAQKSAKIVLVASVVLTVLVGVKVW